MARRRADWRLFFFVENFFEKKLGAAFHERAAAQGAEAVAASTAGADGDGLEEADLEVLGAEAAAAEEEEAPAAPPLLAPPVGGIPTLALPLPPRL